MTFRTLHAAALAALLIALAVFGTGAFTPDPVADSVTVEPAPGPNGEYASIGEDGELTIRITDEGVSPHATTYFDSVFVVTNERATATRFYVEDTAPEVSFYDSADLSSISGETNRQTLSPGETMPVGMVVDATGVEGGTILLEGITIVSAVQATETPTPPPSTPTPTPGEVTPTPDEPTPTPTEPSGGPGPGGPGPGPGGGAPGTGEDTGDPAFTIVSASVSPSTVAAGEVVTVDATVRNTGDGYGRYRVALLVDGERTGEYRILRIPAGETRTATFSESFDDPGTYDVRTNNVSAGTVTVVESTTPTSRPPVTATPDPGPGPSTPTPTGPGGSDGVASPEGPGDGPGLPALLGGALFVLATLGALAYLVLVSRG